ncbi:HAD-IIB family hydrolase [Alloscardovia macacae]|uniref:phosphomannomutase n=1 Tax=Alloscardovia macacae TaxID=1160091 RepID=A0A261F590_9BIFI|nr:HAD-IIB family hydrolase [Alloscardovia macacae]OZG54274.1 eukaryotic phosphomannomutase [Alloscardovia macacae]
MSSMYVKGGGEVPHAGTVDVSLYAAGTGLIAFDLDNTLARSKMPMLEHTADLFASLTHILPVAIVTGGRFELIESQVLDAVQQNAYLPHLALLPTTGTSYYTWNGHAFTREYAVELTADQRKRACCVLEKYAKKYGLWQEPAEGGHIEDRGSQITFSALGAHARADRKEVWDPDGSRRAPLAARAQELLPELTVRVAGGTSIDVYSRGVDKAYAVEKLAELHHIRVQDIVFVGDRMTPGGNDYPAAQAGVRALRVDSPRDTEVFMQEFMESYTRGLRMNVRTQELWVHGDLVDISPTEFSLLCALLHSGGRVMSRQQLLSDAWGYADSGDTRLLSVSIARLRSIIEDNPRMPQRILTVRGGGYRFVHAG